MIYYIILAMQKKYLLFILRIVFSLGIIGFIITKIDLNLFLSTIENFHLKFYLLAVILLLLQLYTFGIGWRLALESKGYKFRSIDIFRTIFVSNFFAIVLPSTFAADLILTFNIGRAIPDKHHAPSSLLYIRMLNILFIVIISIIFLKTVPQLAIFRYLLICSLLFILALYLISLRWLKYLSWMQKHYLTNFIYKILSSFTEFTKKTQSTLKIIPIILIASIARIFIDYLLALSLGIRLPLSYFLAMVPIIMVISIIPISIGGLGIREGAYVCLFGLIGLPKAYGFCISILVFSLGVLGALIGGTIYVIRGSKLKHRATDETR